MIGLVNLTIDKDISVKQNFFDKKKILLLIGVLILIIVVISFFLLFNNNLIDNNQIQIDNNKDNIDYNNNLDINDNYLEQNVGDFNYNSSFCSILKKEDINGKRIAFLTNSKDFLTLDNTGENAQYILVYYNGEVQKFLKNNFDTDEDLINFLKENRIFNVVLNVSNEYFEKLLVDNKFTCYLCTDSILGLLDLNLTDENDYCKNVQTVVINSGRFAIPLMDKNFDSIIVPFRPITNYFAIYNNGVFEKFLENDSNSLPAIIASLVENEVNFIIDPRNIKNPFVDLVKENGIECVYGRGIASSFFK